MKVHVVPEPVEKEVSTHPTRAILYFGAFVLAAMGFILYLLHENKTLKEAEFAERDRYYSLAEKIASQKVANEPQLKQLIQNVLTSYGISDKISYAQFRSLVGLEAGARQFLEDGSVVKGRIQNGYQAVGICQIYVKVNQRYWMNFDLYTLEGNLMAGGLKLVVHGIKTKSLAQTLAGYSGNFNPKYAKRYYDRVMNGAKKWN